MDPGFRRDDERAEVADTNAPTRHAELLILCARIGFNP